mgnify:CR=1 FL=1
MTSIDTDTIMTEAAGHSLSPSHMDRTRTLADPDGLKDIAHKLNPSAALQQSLSSSNGSAATAGSAGSQQQSEAKLPVSELFGGARKGAKQWQEDSYFHYASPNHRVYIGAVFDGHGGYNGERSPSSAPQCSRCDLILVYSRLARLRQV